MASKIVVNLDTSKEYFKREKCKQNDDLLLIANIFENGVAKDLTNCSIVIQAKKNDNTYIIQNTDIEKLNNSFTAELVRDFSRVAGETKIEVVLVESSKQNTTFSFCIDVEVSVIKGAVESSNTVTILENLQEKIVEAGVVKDETEELIKTGGAANKGDIAKVNASLATKANNTDGGLDRLKSTSKFITTLPSYVGLLNTAFLDDMATRFYLLPKGKVTTGVGGCLKIFADAYQDGQDYRDLGIYFHADQKGDKGYYGNGVNWINVKVLDGGIYAGKHPDLGFSFQDGAVVAGRITCFNNVRPVWVFGGGKPSILNTALIAEFQGNLGVTAGNSLKLMTSDDTKAQTISNDVDNILKWSLLNGEKIYINGVQVLERTEKSTDIKNALIKTSRLNVLTDTTSLNVTGYNRVVLNQPNTNIITSITGVDGQEIDLICVVAGKTTIANGTNIKLKSGVNYNMLYNSVLTLICIGSIWYEKGRSDNS